jgi:hypothetical protein
MRIPDTPFEVDMLSSDEHTFYVDIDYGVTIMISVNDTGITVEGYPKHTQNGTVSEPTITCSATWDMFTGE